MGLRLTDTEELRLQNTHLQAQGSLLTERCAQLETENKLLRQKVDRKHLTDDRLVWSAGRPSVSWWGMRRKSELERAALLREVEMSGLALAEFCRRAGLAYSTVLVWRGKAREAAALSPRVFVEVEALPSGAGAVSGTLAGDGGLPVAGGRRMAPSGESGGMERGGSMEQAAEREGCRAPDGSAADSRMEPPWLVELALPGGLLLRIHAPCPDRGGGQSADPPCGNFPASAVRKGGGP